MILLTIVSLFTCVIASSVDIQCEYDHYNFASLDEINSCIVENDLKIYSSDVRINQVKGSHMSGMINDLVTGLVIENKKVEFFPSNLGDKFKNLEALRVKNGRLKEIHQDDLNKFTKLTHINLDENDLEALDEDLFEFNTELKVIWIGKNKIKSMGTTTFDRLIKLIDLDLLGNMCTQERAFGVKVKPAIIKIKQQCYNPNIELENLKLRYLKLKKQQLKSASDNEKLRSKNMQIIKEVLNLKNQKLKLFGSKNIDENDLKQHVAMFNDSPNVSQLTDRDKTTKDQSFNFNPNLDQNNTASIDIDSLKAEMENLEIQLHYQMVQSQSIESNLTEEISQCKADNYQRVIELDETKIRLGGIEKNLTENIKILEDKSQNLESRNNKLEESILNLKDNLQIEEDKMNETLSINNKYMEQLQDCKRNNTELSKQIDQMNSNHQNLARKLDNERKSSHSKTEKFKNILTSAGHKFDNVQKNLTSRFEILYNQTSELLANQQNPL